MLRPKAEEVGHNNFVNTLVRVEEIGQANRLRWLVLFFLFILFVPIGLISMFWIFGPIQGPFMVMVVGSGFEKGFNPNYLSVDLISYFTSAASYISSPHYDFLAKVNLLLSYQVVSIASFDHASGGTNWNLSLGAVVVLGIFASAYHLATHFNILIAHFKAQKLERKKRKAIGIAGPLCAAGANTGNAFMATMIPLACCGGTGVILLFFTAAGIGAAGGYLFSMLGGTFSTAFAVPTTALIFFITIYLAKKYKGEIRIDEEPKPWSRRISAAKLIIYPLLSVLFVATLAIGMYSYYYQLHYHSLGSAEVGYDPGMFVSLAPAAILLSGAAIMEARRLRPKIRFNPSNIQVAGMVVGVAIVIGLTGIIVSTSYQPTTVQAALAEEEIIVGWPHIHGLGTDAKDPIVYAATHNGLYKWSEDSDWSFVGTERLDLNAFVTHPYESGVMFASGHPAGNPVLGLGFIGSTDGGLTWQQISSVLDTPLDFHTMEISMANPNLIYGYASHGVGLFKTNDGGKSWEKIDLPGNPEIVSFAAHPKDVNQVIAITDGGRPLRSLDQGNTWEYVNWMSMEFTTIAYANDGKLYGFVTQDPMGMGMGIRVVKSIDDGETWSVVGNNLLRGEIVSYLAVSPSNTEIVYVASKLSTQTGTISSVYESSDGGANLNLLGTNDKTHPVLSGMEDIVVIPEEYLSKLKKILVYVIN